MDCSVKDCDLPVRSKGMCNAHYQRWLRTGSPGDSRVRGRAKGQTCRVEDCDDPVRCVGLCARHYDRHRRKTGCPLCGGPKENKAAVCRACFRAGLPVLTEKRCNKCQTVKSVESFGYRKSEDTFKLRPHCRECEAAYARSRRAELGDAYRVKRAAMDKKRRENLSPEEKLYRSLGVTAAKLGVNHVDLYIAWKKYHGACAICGKKPKEGQRRLHVDHDHATGKVRGFLCSSCNTAIGHLNDSPETIRAAAQYLENQQ